MKKGGGKVFLVTAEEMREIDRKTIEEIGIPSIVLMENAGSQVAREMMQFIFKPAKIVILSGHGNNGGDGFVTARHLGNHGYDVQTWLIGSPEKFTPETTIHFNALIQSGYKVNIFSQDNELELKESLIKADIIVDALLGTGATGGLREPYKSIIQFVNQTNATKVAIDIPTGVNSNTGEVVELALIADYTITFTLPKIGQYLYPGTEYIGKLKVVDISIPSIVIKEVDPRISLLSQNDLRTRLPIRKRNSHKGTYGHAFIIGGSKNMPGAITLATMAALRTGAGLTTSAVPASIQPMVFSRVPEAICIAMDEDSTGHFALNSIEALRLEEKNYTAIGIGPGIGQWELGLEWFKKLLLSINLPMIIDADGLNLLSKEIGLLDQRKSETILTPHPGEMARLIKRDVAYVEKNRIKVAKEFASEYGVYLLLKGAHSLIATPNGDLYLNPTGGPELAKGGSGDVLTGMITGFVAQKLPILDAVMLAVYLHGIAGNLASKPSNYSTIATDVIDKIGFAMSTLSNHVDALPTHFPGN